MSCGVGRIQSQKRFWCYQSVLLVAIGRRASSSCAQNRPIAWRFNGCPKKPRNCYEILQSGNKIFVINWRCVITTSAIWPSTIWWGSSTRWRPRASWLMNVQQTLMSNGQKLGEWVLLNRESKSDESEQVEEDIFDWRRMKTSIKRAKGNIDLGECLTNRGAQTNGLIFPCLRSRWFRFLRLKVPSATCIGEAFFSSPHLLPYQCKSKYWVNF